MHSLLCGYVMFVTVMVLVTPTELVRGVLAAIYNEMMPVSQGMITATAISLTIDLGSPADLTRDRTDNQICPAVMCLFAALHLQRTALPIVVAAAP
jgi:hypothetical protein